MSAGQLPRLRHSQFRSAHGGSVLQDYQTPHGATVTRSVTRNTESSQHSTRSHQVFDFEGQQMPPGQGASFPYAR